MTEMTLLTLLGSASAAALIGPAALLGYHLYKQASARSFIVEDGQGKVLGEISADSVQRDPGQLTELHDKIRRSSHVSIRAAA